MEKIVEHLPAWNPELDDNKRSFVWKLGSSVVEMLAPQSGERILDLGCAMEQLTAQIAGRSEA